MGIDVEDLLRKARRASGGSGDDGRGPKNDMTEQQQADQLRDCMADFVNPKAFKVGDLVRYRNDCCGYIRNGNRLHMVFAIISPALSVPLDEDTIGSNIAYRRYDTVLCVTDTNDKGRVLKYVADSRELELWPEGDRLKREHS
jgi:hypothetical protein